MMGSLNSDSDIIIGYNSAINDDQTLIDINSDSRKYSGIWRLLLDDNA